MNHGTQNQQPVGPRADDTTPRLALDLSKVLRTWRHGDVTVHLTWTQHDKSPALVLTPTGVTLSPETVTPCIVPLKMAYQWDEHTGDGAHCALTTMIFCANLGLEPEPRTLFRITDAIREHLGDLLTCPPMPTSLPQVTVAEAMIIDNQSGKVVRETEISEDV
jgi:hypothetical protein